MKNRKSIPKKNRPNAKKVEPNRKNKIRIYCDASFKCTYAPKKVETGWGVVIDFKNSRREFLGPLTDVETSNAAELQACIIALSLIKEHRKPVVIYTDSQYVVKGFNSYIYSWMKNNWKSNKGNVVQDKERWLKLFWMAQDFECLSIRHTKGHADCEGNLRAHLLAQKGKVLKERGDI